MAAKKKASGQGAVTSSAPASHTTMVALGKLGGTGLAMHLHGGPQCAGDEHNKACKKHPGTEIQCLRLAPSIKGVKLELFACVHKVGS